MLYIINMACYHLSHDVFMSRTSTYNPNKLPALKKRLEQVNARFKWLGYGSRLAAARWLIKKQHQAGTEEQVAKKISHLLNGYVRGIHPTLRSGGVWRPEEAERIIELLEKWLKSKAAQKFVSESKPFTPPGIITVLSEDEF